MISPGISQYYPLWTPRAILPSLDNGKMRQQATNLQVYERKAVAHG